MTDLTFLTNEDGNKYVGGKIKMGQEPEKKARHEKINPLLEKAGWKIQHYGKANPRSSKGVAVEYFQMGQGVGEADYVLFVNGKAVGIIEAKKPGETLTGKEFQSKKVF